MPKELTHWLIAERAMAGLSNESRLRRCIEAHRTTYLAGAVLPDTLLHLFRGPHAAAALHLAQSFHDTAGNSFAPVIHAEQTFAGDLPPALLACLLGVITHIETDIIFHPFVYALTGTAGIGRHYQIETGIDCHFLRNGTLPAVAHMADLITPESQATIITACKLIFDPEEILPRSALEQALALHCRFQSMYDRTFWKLAIKLLAMIVGAPFRAQRHLFYPLSHGSAVCELHEGPIAWRHPVTGDPHCSTLEELLSEAAERSSRLFTLVEEAGVLESVLSNNPGQNLLTGLQGIRRTAMIRAVTTPM